MKGEIACERKRRDPFFDNMKGILIFLVVLGHGVSSFDESGGAGYDWLYQAIFSFHMPAFLFVSGYFASAKPKKTIARLLPLYLIFQLVQILMRYWEAWIANPRTAEFNLQFEEPGWTLWYLMVLMLYSLVLPLLDTDRRRGQIRNVILAFTAGVLIGFNFQSILDFAALGRAFSFLPFFLLGYYAKKNKGCLAPMIDPAKRVEKRVVILRAVLTAAAVAYLIYLAMPECLIWGKMFYGDLSYRMTDMTAGFKIAGYGISILWIAVLLLWVPNREIPLLRKIGRNTLGVYLFHTILLRMLRMWAPADRILNQHFALMVLLTAGLTLLFSMDCFSELLRRLQNLHTLQIGKRAAGRVSF